MPPPPKKENEYRKAPLAKRGESFPQNAPLPVVKINNKQTNIVFKIFGLIHFEPLENEYRKAPSQKGGRASPKMPPVVKINNKQTNIFLKIYLNTLKKFPSMMGGLSP